MRDLNNTGRKFELDYPCEWQFKLIGLSEELLANAVIAIITNKSYQLELSKQSAKGKYISMTLAIEVSSENERVGLFDKFKNHGDIKMVL